VEALCSLKGVGPKMAFIAMHACWGKAVGIGVDTHVHRIANRLRWVKTSTPEATRDSLQALLPRAMWGGVNVLLVGFGQQVCTPLAPKCASCAIAAICPSSGVRGGEGGGAGDSGGGAGGSGGAAEEEHADTEEEGAPAPAPAPPAKARKKRA
jgi:endonuclease-3